MAAATPARRSVSGQVREKQLTLVLAQALRDELVERGRVRVAMTRDDDRYLTLDDRAAVARRLDAAHVRFDPYRQRAQSACARRQRLFAVRRRFRCRGGAAWRRARIAGGRRRERQWIGRRDARRPRDALADERFGQSRFAAGRTRLRAGSSCGQIRIVSPLSTSFAARSTPAVLFEAGYLSNADDELMLRDPAQRAKMVLALAQAIEADVAARTRR